VSKRLDQLTKEAQEKFDKTVKDAIVKEDTEKDKHLSSSTLSQKISEFQEDLEKRQTKFFQATEEVQKAKQDVVQCLTNNKDKPLNCWDEVKGFEKLVSQIN
jgi:chemotaxis methyl-accepting protein methylase